MEIQEAWKPGNVEAWRLGGLEVGKTGGLEAGRPGGLQESSYEVILGAYRRGLEIQEAWKPGNLEVWRLGGLEAGKTGGLEARRPGGLQQSSYGTILGPYRKQVCWFGNPGSQGT